MAAAADGSSSEPVVLSKKRLFPPQPEPYPYSEAEQQQVRQFCDTFFRPMLTDGTALQYMVTMDECEQIELCGKFMVARKFDPVKAQEMLRGHCKFVRDQGMDYDKPFFPSPLPLRGWDQAAVGSALGQAEARAPGDIDRLQANIAPFYQVTYHKWDKVGHPLYIENTGVVNVKTCAERCQQLAKVGQAASVPFAAHHAHITEVGQRLNRFQNMQLQREGKPPVVGVVVIMNAKDMGYSILHKPFLDMWRVCQDQDAAYYPEGIHRVFVVNCPGMVAFAYGVVKGWLDPRLRDKVEFLKPHETGPRLLEWIDADNLPADLGGSCRCAGGCLEVPPDAQLAGAAGDDLAEVIVIPAGKKIGKEFDGEMGEAISYEFCVPDHNIMFACTFTGVDGNEIEVFSFAKSMGGSDKFVFPSKGKITFLWSNEHSWLRSKNVTLRVFKMSDQ